MSILTLRTITIVVICAITITFAALAAIHIIELTKAGVIDWNN